MKCIIALTILAVAVAQGSVLPLSYSSLAHSAPLIQSTQLIHSAPLLHSAPISYAAHASPLAYAAGPVAVAHAAPLLHAAPIAHAPLLHAEASYVAANRGSVHVAPLPGHLLSAQSVNLQPAPGTW